MIYYDLLRSRQLLDIMLRRVIYFECSFVNLFVAHVFLLLRLFIALIQMFIHILQLRLEIAFQLRPLGLECGRQQTILYRKWIWMQINIFDLKWMDILDSD